MWKIKIKLQVSGAIVFVPLILLQVTEINSEMMTLKQVRF